MRPTLTGIEQVLADAGGADAPRERVGQLRTLLGRELQHGVEELAAARSGYEHPVVVAAAVHTDGLVVVAPIAPELRADPDAVDERAWLLAAALVGALEESVSVSGELTAGSFDGYFALHLHAPVADAVVELFPLAFEEQVEPVDRLKAIAIAVPEALLEDVIDLRAPIGSAHPLRVALEIARLGGRPADHAAQTEHEDAILAVLDAADHDGVARPHDDPDPSRRVARRILQRLDGMGKWGGYHTAFTHLARGFAGNDRALAEEVGEALLLSGLLVEKPSVGQRHVFLNPRRAADIRGLIERGDVPGDLTLP
jgi:hypothetical protein